MIYAITLGARDGKWIAIVVTRSGDGSAVQHATEPFETVDACLHVVARWIAEQEAA